MEKTQIIAFCPNSPIKCWSLVQRCFVARCENILMLATRVLGNRILAERWLIKPAFGLGYQEPCCILATRSGYARIDKFLKQLEHGVYV